MDPVVRRMVGVVSLSSEVGSVTAGFEGHANLMQVRLCGLGCSSTGLSAGFVSGDWLCGADFFGSGLGPHAKEMQRFFASASTAASWLAFSAPVVAAGIRALISVLPESFADGCEFCFKPTTASCGKEKTGGGGLGVLVRAGLVKPVSGVSSAVDARLTVLFIDLRLEEVPL